MRIRWSRSENAAPENDGLNSTGGNDGPGKLENDGPNKSSRPTQNENPST